MHRKDCVITIQYALYSIQYTVHYVYAFLLVSLFYKKFTSINLICNEWKIKKLGLKQKFSF
jgi:hypothetical protein